MFDQTRTFFPIRVHGRGESRIVRLWSPLSTISNALRKDSTRYQDISRVFDIFRGSSRSSPGSLPNERHQKNLLERS